MTDNGRPNRHLILFSPAPPRPLTESFLRSLDQRPSKNDSGLVIDLTLTPVSDTGENMHEEMENKWAEKRHFDSDPLANNHPAIKVTLLCLHTHANVFIAVFWSIPRLAIGGCQGQLIFVIWFNSPHRYYSGQSYLNSM